MSSEGDGGRWGGAVGGGDMLVVTALRACAPVHASRRFTNSLRPSLISVSATMRSLCFRLRGFNAETVDSRFLPWPNGSGLDHALARNSMASATR